MADERDPALLVPSQPDPIADRVFSILEKRRKTSNLAKPPKQDRPTDEETFEWCQGKSELSDVVQRLIEAARGVQLILSSLHDHELPGPVAWSLGEVLEDAIGPADAYYFGSLGELNENIHDVHLALLLKRKLKKVRERIAKDRRRR